MRIGVDCHVLSDKFQGSRTYLYNLYRAIVAQGSSHDFVFFGHWNGTMPFGEDSLHAEFPSRRRWRRLTFETAGLLKEHQVAIYHTQYIAPLLVPANSLVTVHDILFETHPHFFRPTDVVRNRLLVRRSVRTAAQIHTDSEYSRNAIASIYGVPSERIVIVPGGVNTDVFNPGNYHEAVDRVAKRFGVRDYVLSVGRIEPRKNHLGLLEAYETVIARIPDVGPLVVVGQPDFGFREFIFRVSNSPLRDRIHLLHAIDDTWLPELYRAAKLFVYPSFAEGFGIPPIEAQACGVPVICSDRSCG